MSAEGLAHAHGSSARARRQAAVGSQPRKGKSAVGGVLSTPEVPLEHRILQIERGKKTVNLSHNDKIADSN